MTDKRKKLGAWGESVAAHHLEANGYTIIMRNWRTADGEIDLVASKKDLLAFIEVKTRKGNSAGSPENSITRRKAAKMIHMANVYLHENDIDDDFDFSIDVIAVELDQTGKLLRCDHWENAVSGW